MYDDHTLLPYHTHNLCFITPQPRVREWLETLSGDERAISDKNILPTA